MKEMEAKLGRQVRVSKMLGLGFVFSMVPYVTFRSHVMGALASLLSLIIGLKALSLIRRSEEKLNGLDMALWCIIVGAAGACLFLLLILLSRKFPHL